MSWHPPEHRPDEAYVEAVIIAAAQRHDPHTLDGRARLVDDALPALRRVRHPIYRDGYLRLLARVSGVDEILLRDALLARPRADA